MGKRLYKTYREVSNIVVRVSNGTAAGKAHAILVNAHLDSTLPSPGAADDALSCGVMLEAFRVLTQTPGWSPQHAMILRECTPIHIYRFADLLIPVDSVQQRRGVITRRISSVFYSGPFCFERSGGHQPRGCWLHRSRTSLPSNVRTNDRRLLPRPQTFWYGHGE